MIDKLKNGLPGYSLAAVLLLSVFLYLPSLSGGWVGWDDGIIRDNPAIRTLSFSSIYNTFVPSGKAFLASYQPLRSLTYTLVYAVGGDRLKWFFLFNLLLHSINVLLLFVTLRYLVERWGAPSLAAKARWIALAAALLFAVHPTHVEVISWHEGGKQSLMAAFYLAAFYCYLRFMENKRTVFYISSFAAYLAALAVQPGAVSLPLVLLAAEWISATARDNKPGAGPRGRGWLRTLPFFLPALALGYHLMFVSSVSSGLSREAPLVSRLFTVPALWGKYLIKLMVPVNICSRYPLQAPQALSFFPVPAWLLFLATAGWLFFRLAGGGRLGVLALSLFASGLLPTSGLVSTSTLMADRYLYLPATGVFLAAGIGLVRLLEGTKDWHRSLALALLATGTVSLAVVTLARQRDWRSDVSLWSRVVEVYPRHSLGAFNLAYAMAGRGQDDKAICLYRRAIEIDPAYGDAWANLATLLAQRGEISRAVAAIERAAALRPDRTEVWLKRGIIYSNAGMDSLALESFTRAVGIEDRTVWIAFFDRGMSYLKLGDNRRALDDFDRAVSLGAGEFGSGQWQMMANALDKAGLATQAVELLERGVQSRRFDSGCWLTLGNMQLIAGRSRQAIQTLLQATALDSTDYRLWVLLGVARQQTGQPVLAADAYHRALALGTANRPEILNNLGLALQADGSLAEAERAWLQALELNADYLAAHLNLAAFYIGNGFKEKAAAQLSQARRLAAGRPQAASIIDEMEKSFDSPGNRADK